MVLFIFISVYLTREPSLAGHVAAPILLQKMFVLDCGDSVSSTYLLANILNSRSS